MDYDLIIKNGNIIDGTGNPWYRADVGIKDGKIDKIGRLNNLSSFKEIDAVGLVLTPGFIDIHSHSDFAIPFDPHLESTIRQGITTAVIGNCGDSLAPINVEKLELFQKLANMFSPPGEMINITWQTFEDYLSVLEKGRCSTNIVPLVGFGTIRIAGGPGFEDRAPTPEELEHMKLYIDEAMQSGAFGMSTGLIYSPQIYAKTEEIVELAKIVAKYGGLYFSHIRGEGETVVKAVKELIEIVGKSGCIGGQIAHHKASGRSNWGKSKETLSLIEEANTQGLNITCDQYPYDRGMTSLITVLPPWVHIGGIEKILDRLKNPKDRVKIKQDIIEGIEGWENWIKDLGSDRIYISSVKTKPWKDIEGKNLAEITKLKGKPDVFSTLFDLLLEEKGEVSILVGGVNEEDIRRIMTNKYTMIGTDGWGVSPTGILNFGKPHPRFYGTYPRILGKYVRQESLLKLEDAIRKMTSFPAQKLGLQDRGLIRENMYADVVVFDHKTVIDRATYEDPHQFPTGIKHVIVNGEIVVENEKQTEKLPGRILKHK
ncbi:MAG: N-acyl-D-amino-acid deacylase family protein [Candidatus Hodarchaeales archaeon]|jgi:N-acyl-D-amino-acid deacylase